MKKLFLKTLIILSILCTSFISFSQLTPQEQSTLDSLNTIISDDSHHDTIIIINMLESLNYFYFEKPELAMNVCQDAFNKSDKINYRKGQAESLRWTGFLNEQASNIDDAIQNYQKSLKIDEELNNLDGIAYSCNNLGAILYSKGNIPVALEYYQRSMKIDEDRNNLMGMANAYNNIGIIHDEQNQDSLALLYYLKSLKLDDELEDKEGMTYAYNHIGSIYKDRGDYERALEYMEKSLDLLNEIGYKRGLGAIHRNIGDIYIAQSKMSGVSQELKDSLINKALLNGEKSLEIRQEINDERGLSKSHCFVGNVHFERGDFKSASLHGELGLSLGKKLGYPELIGRNANLLRRVFERLGDFKFAYDMRNLEILMRDSLTNVEALKAASNQQAKYEYTQKKVVDDILHEKNLAIEKETQKRQFIVLIIVIIASALVLILLIIIYRRLRITRKQKLVIEEQKEEVETQRDQIEGQKDEIEQKHGEIQESIAYAKRIQNAILPPDSLISQHLPNNFVYYQPKDVVAGDFYWMEVHDDVVFFAAADCTGHGVPGAMVSVVCHNALNRAVREFGLRDTGKILDKVRELVLITFEKSEEQMKDGMDICLCALNKKSNSLQYSGANNPLYLIKDGELETIKGTKQPIGHVQDPKPFESHDIDLKDIHSFYLTTDGYADQFGGPKNKKFSYKKLREMLLENSSKPMNEQHDILKSQLNNWIEQGSDEQIDDICIIGVKL